MSFFQQFMKRFRHFSSAHRPIPRHQRRFAFEPLEERRLLAAVPTTFKAEDNGGTSVEIAWDLMPGATGYELQRSINGIDQWNGFGPSLIATDDELPIDAYRSYYFRIRSVEVPASGPTIYSNWTDPAEPIDPNDPADGYARPTNDPEDNTVKVSAIAHSQIDVPLIAATIELRWPEELAYQDADYKVYRKEKDETSFTLKATLTYDGQNPIIDWTDDDLAGKTAYEYLVERSRKFGATHPFFSEDLKDKTVFPPVVVPAIGYVYAGVDVPLDDPDSSIESPGTVILIVDDTQAAALANELDRLENDLIAEGWGVKRHDVVRHNDVPASNTHDDVHALILGDYTTEANVTTVLLIGHVPIPMSGWNNPDGHLFRPMPADVYYGDMDVSLWTDTQFLGTGNIIGDGIFDQKDVPTDGDGKPVELMVGRVDMSDLPNFGIYNPGLTEAQLETELLRRYLDKDHAFRTGQVVVERGALIRDQFAFPDSSTGAWQTLSGFFVPATNPEPDEPDNIDVNKWTDTNWPLAVGLRSGKMAGIWSWPGLSLAL